MGAAVTSRTGLDASPLVLAVQLAPFWESRGEFTAGRQTLEGALASVPAAPADQAAGWEAVALLATGQGDLDGAQHAYEQALRIHGHLDDARGAATVRNALAAVFLRGGSHDLARSHAEAALRTFCSLSDVRGEAFARSSLGLIDAAGRRPGDALEQLLTSLQLFREQGARPQAAAVLTYLGDVSQDFGDNHRAARFYDGALELFEQLHEWRGAAVCLNNLSMLARNRNDLDHAVELAQRALSLFAKVGDTHGEAGMYNNLAGLWQAQGANEEAARLYDSAIVLFHRNNDAPALAMAEENRGRLRPVSGDLSRRELEVAGLVAEGLSNREIAARLFVSQRTVDSHLDHIFTKLSIKSRTQLAMWLTRSRGAGKVTG